MTASTTAATRQSIRIKAQFCPALGSPFDTVQWRKATAVIKDESGKPLFEQKDIDVPADWSPLAVNVVASKYFYGENGTAERESSIRQLIHRVVRTIADWGRIDGYFASDDDAEWFYRELAWLCLHQHGAFNSPVWFNVGLSQQYGVKGGGSSWVWDESAGDAVPAADSYKNPQGSACFIQSVDDTMESIMELARSEAMLFKFGSGTGTDLSTLRAKCEKLAGGGKPSGPLSFMRVYDQIAAVVKSGGKTRRAAKMQSMKDWHPDVLDFIECKLKEEDKARALIQAGYDSNFNGEAYSSVMFQNANLSVRLSDEFMKAVKEDGVWTTHWVTDPTKTGPSWPARELLGKMAECAWRCGDPGVQYDTTTNDWHTCPNSGRINASNPCAEYVFLNDTACNLASLNLMKFRCDNGTFDAERFAAACRIFLIAQEILVDRASYPTKKIAANSHRFRPLGLGFANLGTLLMMSGLPYDSDAGRGMAGAITAIMHGAANLASIGLAAAVGPFDGYAENRDAMRRVMRMHREAVNGIHKDCPSYLVDAAHELWESVDAKGAVHGFRNAQVTVLAPTGTIAFLMDCDTTGVEPDIALVKYKQLAGGGMLKIVNKSIGPALQSLGYDAAVVEAARKYVELHDKIEGFPALKEEHVAVFDCAFPPPGGGRSIAWQGHVKMMAAAQPFLSGAISKTVNMPRESTPDDIAEAYMMGWDLGLKALAVYRDGSKDSQPLSTSKEGDKKDAKGVEVVATAGAAAAAAVPVEKIVEKVIYRPRRERLPDTRQSVTHKFNVAGHEGYLTVGLYDDGRPGELFVTMAKEGSTVGGMVDAFGTAVSLGLQYGVPLDVFVRKFSHVRFEPMGPTGNADIPLAKSIVDYLARWLGKRFQAGNSEPVVSGPIPAKVVREVVAKAYPVEPEGDEEDEGRNRQFARFQGDAPPCPTCGAITVRNGACYLCHGCGTSLGCS